jgi:hypothetical protein
VNSGAPEGQPAVPAPLLLHGDLCISHMFHKQISFLITCLFVSRIENDTLNQAKLKEMKVNELRIYMYVKMKYMEMVEFETILTINNILL